MVVNATFNNISVISWWSVLVVEETGVPGENHQHVTVICNRSVVFSGFSGFLPPIKLTTI
jgi:hypothetical protein